MRSSLFAIATLFSAKAFAATPGCIRPNDHFLGRVPADIRPAVVGAWYFLNADVVSVVSASHDHQFTIRTCARNEFVADGTCENYQEQNFVYSQQRNVLCSVGQPYECYEMIGFRCGTGNRPDEISINTDTESRFPGTGSAYSGERFE